MPLIRPSQTEDLQAFSVATPERRLARSLPPPRDKPGHHPALTRTPCTQSARPRQMTSVKHRMIEGSWFLAIAQPSAGLVPLAVTTRLTQPLYLPPGTLPINIQQVSLAPTISSPVHRRISALAVAASCGYRVERPEWIQLFRFRPFWLNRLSVSWPFQNCQSALHLRLPPINSLDYQHGCGLTKATGTRSPPRRQYPASR